MARRVRAVHYIVRTMAIQMNILWRVVPAVVVAVLVAVAALVVVAVFFVLFFYYFGFHPHRDVNIGPFLLSDLSMALCVRF